MVELRVVSGALILVSLGSMIAISYADYRIRELKRLLHAEMVRSSIERGRVQRLKTLIDKTLRHLDKAHSYIVSDYNEIMFHDPQKGGDKT